jgi:hypothetical protein
MEALKYNTIIKKDGEISLSGVPFKKGQKVEMIILLESKQEIKPKNMTGLLPKHKMGSGDSNLSRDNIYEDAR